MFLPYLALILFHLFLPSMLPVYFVFSVLFGPFHLPFVSLPPIVFVYYRPVVHFVHSLGELLFPGSILHISSAPTLPLSSTSTT
jgi:hypothetical protein